MSGRLAPLFLALAVGVGSGIYIFKPVLKQYEADTHGTFRPEDKDFKVSKQAPLASTVAVPPSIPEEQAPIQPHLVTKTDGDRPKQV